MDGLRLLAGKTGDVGDGIFVGIRVLGDVSGDDLEVESNLGEEFAATGRCGGQDQHISIMQGGYAARAASNY